MWMMSYISVTNNLCICVILTVRQILVVMYTYVMQEPWLGQFMVTAMFLILGWYASGFRSESFAICNYHGNNF